MYAGVPITVPMTVAAQSLPELGCPAVGIGDGVANVHEPTQEISQGQAALPWITARFLRFVEAADRLFEAVPLDEPHGIERPPICVLAQAVHGHNARML
jgi:hypothetical protein